jgi:3-deoxy-D-manno-octulosonic-acid transferase
VRPVYGLLRQILVQETDDVARWQSFGLDASLIHLTGSVKYDPEGSEVPSVKIDALRQLLHERGIEPGRPVLLAASTHDGEEVEIAKVFQKLKARHPRLALLIVPRHVERAAEIVASLESIGLHAALRSQEGARVDEGACLLIDSTGELAAWQHLATLVVIGKSFLAEGGQNPAEAVFAGKPVLFGPHMENFTPLVDLLLRHRGAMQVRDFDDLETQLDSLLKSPGDLARNGQQARQVHAGATRRTVERVLGA